MFALNNNIKIGKYFNIDINEVKINKSVFSYVDKAVIKVPTTARIQRKDGTVTGTGESAKLIERGDKVVIELGYNSSLKTEFIGFVTRINLSTPVEIECEGYVYQLRNSLTPKLFKKTTLKELLQYIIQGTDITLADDIPDMKIERFLINGESGAEILEKLKKELLVSSFFTGTVLYSGLQYLNRKSLVKYDFSKNVIKADELKLREAKNQDVVVKVIGQEKTGRQITVETSNGSRKKQEVIKKSATSGSLGETVRVKTHSVMDENTLKAMAEKKRQTLSYDGYEGKITTFLEPYCEPADTAQLTDPDYPDRSGKYVINSVEVTYGMSGARRNIGIGFKVD